MGYIAHHAVEWSTGGDGSTSISVNASTTALIVIASWFHDDNFQAVGFTYDSDSFTEQVNVDDDTGNDGGNESAGCIFTLANPSTGSNTFAWDITKTGTQTLDAGQYIYIIEVDDVDTSNLVRDTDFDSNGDTTTGAATATVTSTTGDHVFGLYAAEDSLSNPSGTQLRRDNGVGDNYPNNQELVDITAGASTTTLTDTAGTYASAWLISLRPAAATVDQDGFAFGDDDGSESAHTLDTEDTNHSGAVGTKTLRVQLDAATGDPATAAYKLKFQKNGTGGYIDVPVGSGGSQSDVVIESGDVTRSGSNSTSTSLTVSHPAYSSGDLIILNVGYWQNNNQNNGLTWPSGKNSETLTEIVNDYSGSGNFDLAIIGIAWYIATSSESAGSFTVTADIGTRHDSVVTVVPSGEFDSTTPITAPSGGRNFSTSNSSSPGFSTFSAASDDGNGKLCVFLAVDQDPISGTPTGYTDLVDHDQGRVSIVYSVRDTNVSDSESITGATWTVAGDAFSCVPYIVRSAPAASNDLYIATSSNVTAGGEATTARLTAPSGKTTGSNFNTGRRWDDENGSDSIDIDFGDYTELEWVITITSGYVSTDYADFRVYNGDTALDNYAVTPRWTISSGVTLVINDAAHSHNADNIGLTQAHALVLQDAAHSHTAENIDLTQDHQLTVADAEHSHSADNVDLTQAHQLVTDDAEHSHSVDNVDLTQQHVLSVDDSTHSHTADGLTLTQLHELVIAAAEHSHTADNLVLNVSADLEIADAEHSHTADNLVLTQLHQLLVADAEHGHSAGNIDLTQDHQLAVDDSEHTHSADNLDLTQAHQLAADDAEHSHTADNVTLSTEAELTVADAEHSHAADNVDLTQDHQLAVDEAEHAHTADNVELSGTGLLVVQDAEHSHTADNLDLTQQHSLSVDDSEHSQTSDNLALTQNHQLEISGGAHSHTADNVELSVTLALTIGDALHGHTSDNIALTQLHQLVVDAALHSHTADEVALTQDHVLIIDDALHALLSDVVLLEDLSIETATGRIIVVTESGRTVEAGANPRTVLVATSDRILTGGSDDRCVSSDDGARTINVNPQ